MLEDFELDPKLLGLALLGGLLSIYVMKNTTSGIFIKIISFALTTVVCYIMLTFMQNK